MAVRPFRFKKFEVRQEGAAHPVGTDGVLLGAWADVEGCQRILDIGTGTGVVALMLAQRTEAIAARIVAVEIHPPSASLARQNFAASPWAGRLEVVAALVQDFAQQTDLLFDLIICNPPFFSETVVSPDTARRLGRHTATLMPGDLLEGAKKLLEPGGRLCVILPVKEGRRLCELAVPQGLYCTEEVEVRSRPGKPAERLLLRFERNPYVFEKKQLNIYAAAEGERYSVDFHELTKYFYV